MNTLDNNMLDFRQRFVFDELDVRGCIVRLDDTCQSIQTTHHYPDNLARVLNQFALAAALLRDSVKFEGSLTIQLRTEGSIKLVMADCLADRKIRAIAEYDQEKLAPNHAINLSDLGSKAILAITISPEDGERYQSIVPIEHATLSECLRDYFERSEQLPSTFNFFADSKNALGIALHALPAQKVSDKKETENSFERLNVLLKSLTEEEALTLSSEEVLTRLFHEESCRLFDAYQVEFGCVCSRQKSSDVCFQRYEFEFDELINNAE